MQSYKLPLDSFLSVRSNSHSMVMELFLIPEHHSLSLYVIQYWWVCVTAAFFSFVSPENHALIIVLSKVCSEYLLVSNSQPNQCFIIQ